MKKVLIIVAIVVMLGAIAFLAYTTFHNLTDDPIPDIQSGEVVQPPFSLAEQVKVEAITVRNKTDNIDINNVYPAITSFKNKEFENAINKEIAGKIADYRNEISSIVDELTPDVKLYKYVTTYRKNTWGNYLTLIVEQDYQTGGIRSDSWKDIYNIDAEKERIIYLSDLFEPTTDYENIIISEITKQSALKNYKLMGGDGITKIPTKQKFYIQDGKLIIYFDPSEVAATVYGALEFEMPFTLNSKGYFEIKK